MTTTIRLYPHRKDNGQDFTKDKIVTMPNQAMTLREIIRRFVRKESLPLEMEGFYSEKFGDLEKMSRQDITVKMERAEAIKTKLEKGAKAYKARTQAGGESPSDQPPKGDVTGGAVGGQAPPAAPPASGGNT